MSGSQRSTEVPADAADSLRHLRGRNVVPPGDDTKHYLCARNRTGYQLAIVARQVDELATDQVPRILTTPTFRAAPLTGTGGMDNESLVCTLANRGWHRAACGASTTALRAGRPGTGAVPVDQCQAGRVIDRPTP